MTGTGFDIGLDDPQQSGIFFVTADDIATLGMAARDAGLDVARIDLRGCADKATLLLRLAHALDTPAGQGRNWDALADQLRDLSWRDVPDGKPGHVLLFDDAQDLRDADEASFDTLLEILEDTAGDWSAQELPFWAFLALPEHEFEPAN